MVSGVDSSLALGEEPALPLRNFTLQEGLSQRTVVQVELDLPTHVDLASALLQRAALTVNLQTRHGFDHARSWVLELSEARLLSHEAGLQRVLLTLHDPLARLGLGLNTRKFRNQTTQTIVSTVLDAHGIAYQWSLFVELAPRNYTVQYRESDLAFVERLLALEGIFYQFSADGTLVLRDRSTNSPLLREGVPFELCESNAASSEVGLYAISRGARVAAGMVTLGDHDWKKPHVALRASAQASADADLEIYDYPAGYRSAEEGARLAQMRLEAQRVNARYVRGQANDPSFEPGVGFSVGGFAAVAFAGEFLVTSVEHRFQGSEEGPAGSLPSYTASLSAVPLTTPFRAPLPARPTIDGTHTAMVRGPQGAEIHTDTHGRFKAQFHWDREAVGSEEDSRWLRLIQETSSSMAVARVGWEMAVGYIDGDPERPIGLGRCINGSMPPTFALPEAKTRMSMRTLSSPATGGFSEVMMEDAGENEQMRFKAEKDLDLVTRHHKSEVVAGNASHFIGSDLKSEVLADQSISVGQNESRSVGRHAELQVRGNRSVSVGGSETVKVGGPLTQTIGGGDTEIVGGLRLSLVGAPRIPTLKQLMANALAQLDPRAAVDQVLKDPLGALVASAEGYSRELVGSASDAFAASGKKLGKAALSAARESYDKGGIKSALKAGLHAARADLPTRAGEGAWEAASAVEAAAKAGVRARADRLVSLGGYFKPSGAQPRSEGLLPTLAEVRDLYSKSALQAGLRAKGEAAVNALSAGTASRLFPKQPNGEYGSPKDLLFAKGQNGFTEWKPDWAAITDLAGLFLVGGIEKTASVAMNVIVGAASAKVALSPISWGARFASVETIGALKLSQSAGPMNQVVGGQLKVSVGGNVERGSDSSVRMHAKGPSSISCGSLSATTSGDVKIHAAADVVISGPTIRLIGGDGMLCLTGGNADLSGQTLAVSAAGTVTLSGGTLKVGAP